MPRSRPSKLRLIAYTIVLGALLVGAYGAFWWIAAERLKSAAIGWIETRKLEGYRINYRALETQGFPTRLRLTFRDPSIATPVETTPVSWSGSHLVAEISPWAPFHVTLVSEGPQQVTIRDPSGPQVYTGMAAIVSASIASDHSLPLRAVAVRDLLLTGRNENDVVAAERLDMAIGPGEASPDEESVYDVSVRASDLRLPARLRLPLGEHVSRLLLDADVLGAMPPHPWPRGLFEWRDAGGIVEISGLELHYGPLRLTGTGTLALDGNGQPMGAFVARADGVHETLNALHQKGLLPGFGVASARLVLKVLSRSSETGLSGLNVSLTLQDRTLSAASFRLFEIPAIMWAPGVSGGP